MNERASSAATMPPRTRSAVNPKRRDNLAGRRAVTADTALRFSRALGTTPGFWLGLQADYDTEEVLRVQGDELSKITILAA